MNAGLLTPAVISPYTATGPLSGCPPNLFSRVCWESLDIEDDTAELSEPEYKKNGDLHCRLKIRGHGFGQEREVSVTLFKDTNKCFVRINDERAGHDTNVLDVYGIPLSCA
ncbi:hypothetical protein [uncultured Alistipes sp.]|uniref:hypothetical protein n=1 Tax=uncultured Alistipes sp. TaxID=538949 RepID=UPI0025D2CC49|nr:hypothetical protein [uncultured Alistipes sp.]